MIAEGVLTVFWFELRRGLTLARLVWWGVLAAFPALIVGMIRVTTAGDSFMPPPEVWTVFLFAMVPMLVSMLGTFLWATPAISGELEGKSWVYLAVRPHGTTVVLLGKYLATLFWAMSAAIGGLLLAVILVPLDDRLQIVQTILPLTMLSCPAYGALYLLLGALFPKRSMVIAVAYTLIFELIVSMIPALINTFTVQFRLRTLLFQWGELSLGDNPNVLLAFVGDPPAWEHVLVLLTLTAILLLAAVGVAREREFSATDEGNG